MFRVLSTFAHVNLRSANIPYERSSGSNLNTMLEFAKSPSLLHSTRITRQSREYFARFSRLHSTFMAHDTLFTISCPHHAHPSSYSTEVNQGALKSFHSVPRRGNFVKPLEKHFAINPPESIWNPFCDPGPLCGVSEVGVLTPRGRESTVGLVQISISLAAMAVKQLIVYCN